MAGGRIYRKYQLIKTNLGMILIKLLEGRNPDRIRLLPRENYFLVGQGEKERRRDDEELGCV